MLYNEKSILNDISYIFPDIDIDRVVNVNLTNRLETKHHTVSDENILFITHPYVSALSGQTDKYSNILVVKSTIYIRVTDGVVKIVKSDYKHIGIKNGDNFKQVIRDKKLNELI